MKRFDSDARIAWINLCQKRERKRLKKLKSKRKYKNSLSHQKLNNTQIIVQAPEIFELRHNKNHKKLISFIKKLRDNVLIQKNHIIIDFSKTRRMVVCGSLLFFAELDRIKRKQGSLNLISCYSSKDETVNQVLKHLEIYQLLNHRCSTVPIRPDVVNWKFASGDNTNACEVGQILEEQSNLSKSKSKKLYRGISEAMTNVSQHAYIRPRNDGTGFANEKGWWMFYREEDEKIFVAFCDLGVGIPVTLPQTTEKSILDKALEKLGITKHSDGRLIQAAIEVKRSRTEKKHRGKGLLDMIKTLENTKSGRLSIFSNKGGYFYNQFKHNRI